MLKVCTLLALFVLANAGNILTTYEAAPTVYGASSLGYGVAPVAIHAPAVGTSHQSTLRSLDGNSAISHYSKSVDTAFSSVRKVDTRVTNDAKIITPMLSYAAAAPIVKSVPLEYAKYAYETEPHVVSHTTFSGFGATYAF